MNDADRHFVFGRSQHRGNKASLRSEHIKTIKGILKHKRCAIAQSGKKKVEDKWGKGIRGGTAGEGRRLQE